MRHRQLPTPTHGVDNATGLAHAQGTSVLRNAVVGLVALLLLGVSSAGVVTAAASPTPAAKTTTWPGGTWQPDPASYGMTVVSGVPVTMDDGTVLPANIGYPTDLTTGMRVSGTFPVLVTQNGYAGPLEQPDPFYVDRGYIFVSVDVRGDLDSAAPGGGPLVNKLFSPRETKDGVEVVKWAAQLDGSNGVVGLTGCSALGIDQMFTAAALGPNSPVKAILPACASNSYGIYFAGGIPGPTIGFFGNPAFADLGGTTHAPENLAYAAALRDEVLAGGARAYNNKFWRERTTSPAMAAKIVSNGIPALLWSGWNAPDAEGALEFYAGLQNAWAGKPVAGPMRVGQKTTGRYQIVVGPWGHGQGLDQSIDLEWFDTWLKGEHTGMANTKTPMHLFDNGTSQWLNAAAYPVAARYTRLYLASGHALAASPARKAQGRAARSSSDTVRWGQPTKSGTTLSYTTPAFNKETGLAGPITAKIYASSSNKNLELISTLFDVAPSGKATQISSGALLGSMRSVNRKLSWYDKDGRLVLPTHPFRVDHYTAAHTTAVYDIKLLPAVWSLARGHSLRLTLSTQEPNDACTSLLTALSPAIPCLLTTPQKKTLPGGTYRIDRSRMFPSKVNVPLVPANYLPAARSAITPTSSGLTEPLGWSSRAPR